jgi:hypothetical protein
MSETIGMSYPEAMQVLRGNHDWWFYELHGSEYEPDPEFRARVQAEAISVAQGIVPIISVVKRPSGCASGACGRAGLDL